MDIIKCKALVAILFLSLSGCMDYRTDAHRPERRELGKDFATFQAAQDRAKADDSMRNLAEPTGVLTLREALTQGLMKNPELRAFSWEVRAGEGSKFRIFHKPM